jgi:hypothetical protein
VPALKHRHLHLRLLPLLASAAFLLPVLPAPAGAASATPVRSCENLGLTPFDDGTTVTSAVDVPASGSLPEYCQVTLLVPERINIMVLLPTKTWNGRYQAVGNAVYAGSFRPPTSAVADGYVASATDTGHQDSPLSGKWAWSPTGMNTAQIQDFAHRANHQMALKSKALIKRFYQRRPSYSYWNGCSTGGREGLTEAVRYPTDFDGIVAAAPAINWTRFIPSEMWPELVMKELGDFLPACKADAVRAIVTAACDSSDGLQDGLFDPRACDFDAARLVGQPTPCGSFTQKDAEVIQKIWEGPRRANGEFMWYGLEPGAQLTALGGTVTAPDGTAVDGVPFPVSDEWFRWWLHKDPTWDWHSLSFEQFERDFDQSVAEWADPLATDDPDLSAFRKNGGKVVIWHGLWDQLIFPRGTIDYYDRVVDEMGGLRATGRFARLFLAPNVAHCGGGTGPAPQDPLSAVRRWRENDVAPKRLLATLAPHTGVNTTDGVMTRPLCAYPRVARYKGRGSTFRAESFTCRSTRRSGP